MLWFFIFRIFTNVRWCIIYITRPTIYWLENGRWLFEFLHAVAINAIWFYGTYGLPMWYVMLRHKHRWLPKSILRRAQKERHRTVSISRYFPPVPSWWNLQTTTTRFVVMLHFVKYLFRICAGLQATLNECLFSSGPICEFGQHFKQATVVSVMILFSHFCLMISHPIQSCVYEKKYCNSLRYYIPDHPYHRKSLEMNPDANCLYVVNRVLFCNLKVFSMYTVAAYVQFPYFTLQPIVVSYRSCKLNFFPLVYNFCNLCCLIVESQNLSLLRFIKSEIPTLCESLP
jgi:hypothetical protein